MPCGLNLENNALKSLPGDVFKYNTALENLYVYDNPLGCVYDVPNSTEIDRNPSIKTPRCPSNCAVDTFYDASNIICRNCSVGTYTDGVGAANCTLCPPGYYCAGGGDGKQACAAGKYSAQTGASACVACGSGKYSAQIGASACVACGSGTYSTRSGANTSDTCIFCVSGTYSTQSGANTVDACIACIPGKYSTTTRSLIACSKLPPQTTLPKPNSPANA